jgi:predicted methyltransferase
VTSRRSARSRTAGWDTGGRPRLRAVAAAQAIGLVSILACGGASTPRANTPSEQGASTLDAKLRAALEGPQRTLAERARDVHRHPRETLEFFGLRDDMSVIELAPGEGWYTAVLAPVLAERGKLGATTADPNGPPESESTKSAKALLARFTSAANSSGHVRAVVINWKTDVSLGPDRSADMVLTFRNAHNWLGGKMFDKVLAATFKVLKPGGILGLTDHRANPGGPTAAKAIGDTGYVPEAYLIEQVEAAGFKLAAKSEINANPKDTKDYPKGVWTLPPTYALGDVDRARFTAIGESDRMTLKFVKPEESISASGSRP